MKCTAIVLMAGLLMNLWWPTICLGLTGGAGSPEFASFEPVATTDMVNAFTGEFTYNLPIIYVPGPGGGYPLSLSYHSGNSVEQDASWVGFGWTLNPGAINRNVRGVPDEYNGDKIDYYNKAIPNWTISGGVFSSFETMSSSDNAKNNKDKGSLEKHSPHGLNFGYNIRYNNYQGYNGSASIGASFKGYGSLGMQASPTGITFSADLDVQGMLSRGYKSAKSKVIEKRDVTDNNKLEVNKKSPNIKHAKAKKALKSLSKFAQSIKPNFGITNLSAGSDYGLLTFAEQAPNIPTSVSTGFGFNYNSSKLLSTGPNIGLEVGHKGGFMMQYNKPYVERASFGFLHNKSNPGKDIVSDYYVEKSSSWDPQDLYLGVPFSTPDYFNLSGEGLSGSFRLHNSNPGHFFPTLNSSRKLVYNLGAEFQVGVALGIGLNAGVGYQQTTVKKWGQYDGETSVPFPVGKGTVMRFAGDKGGSVTYGNDDLINAKVFKQPKFPGIAAGRLDFSKANITPLANVKSSSPIVFNSGLTQFTITNKDGVKFSYGEKIHNNKGGSITGATAFIRNEASLGIDVAGSNDGYLAYGAMILEKENDHYKVDRCTHKILNGEIKTKPYANTYMLGEILSPYYVDIDHNGPTENDFGSWTKFSYHKKYGKNNDEGNNNWYRWRIPYNGFFYDQNSISEEKDDIGSVSTGEKEVYYLKQIETKTHVAYFVTNKSLPDRFNASVQSSAYLFGSQKERIDGYGALKITKGVDSAGAYGIKGKEEVEQLEKIVLFSKKRPGKPLKINWFKYDHQLVNGIPNGGGKLTLKKVWTTYEGVTNAKISPYTFTYQYKPKDQYPQELVALYHNELGDFFNLSNGSSGKYSGTAENPAYSPHLLGPWGFTQPRGTFQYRNQRPWLFQGKLSKADDYDPAAWQLKQITLPTGGQILVEYEAKDYSYVQNRRPMAMVSIKDYSEAKTIGVGYDKHPSYVVNLSDVGISPNDQGYHEKANALTAYLIDYYINKRNRIYFKFLYDLVGNNPSLNNCSAEYITGYVKVKNVELDPKGIKITLDGTGSAYGKNKAGYSMVPRQGCYDFYATQRVGKVKVNNNCNPKMDGIEEDKMINYLNLRERCEGDTNIFKWPYFVGEFAGFAKTLGAFFTNLTRPVPPIKLLVCKEFNPSLSYLKIPMLTAKRGGGIRVKKLLLLDHGMENGDAMIYGKQYHYVNEEGESSGVATNEPASMREENALVGFLPKKNQSWLGRLAIGKDKEQSEGPLGESLLPAPSVGYTRVIEEDIHTGKSTAGFTVYAYNTVKDFPFDKVYTTIGKTGRFVSSFENGLLGVESSDLKSNTKKDLMNLELCKGGIVFGYKSKKIWAAQGFRFVQNDMHGKPSSVKTYGGILPVDFNIDEGNAFVAQGEEYHYYEPGEKVPVMNPNGEVVWDTPGKEMDITMDMRSAKDWGLDLAIAIDFSIALPLAPPVITPSFAGASIGYNEKILSTHSTSKVIKYPSTIKSITTYRDGLASIVENLGFDKATGETILTSSRDIFDGIKHEDFTDLIDGKTFQLKLPAHWYYESLSTANRLAESAGNILSFGREGKILEEQNWHFPAKIISANVQTYGIGSPENDNNGQSYHWFPAEVVKDYGGNLGHAPLLPRPSAQYTFSGVPTNKLLAGQETKKLFEEGVVPGFEPFDFTLPNSNSKWLMLNKITKYSPNGEPLEDKDIEGVYSAVKYAHNKTRLAMQVSNAQYEEIHFNAYEDRVSKEHHSGLGALEMGFGTKPILENILITDHLLNEGAVFKCWFYDPQAQINFKLNLKANYKNGTAVIHTKQPKNTAKVGAWILKELHLSSQELQDVYYSGYQRGTSNNSGEELEDISIIAWVSGTRSKVYIDDVRFQPKDAAGACYVYDQNTLKMVTQFDDAHFGTYFQYNFEGKLIRKLLETERGLKTLEETHYNLPLVNK